MNNRSHIQVLPFAAALAVMPLVGYAAPAGTLLFTKGGMQIVDPSGASRIGKAGDLLQPGDRVVTPDGAVCQIKLWDGTLVGVRPDTELKVELPEQASDRAKSVIQVLKGGLRVINLDLRDGQTRVPVTLQSPTGVVDLTNADAESRVVSREALKKAGVKDPGLYTRVQIGKGTIRTGTVEVPIAVRTVAFTPTIDVAPTLVTSSSTSLFTTTSLSSTTLTTATLDPNLTTSLSTTTLDPKLTTSLSTTTIDPTLTTSLSTTTLEPTLSTSTLSTSTLSSTFTSPTLATTTYTAPTTTTSTTLTSPTLSTTYIAPTTYTAPTTTTTMVSSTTLSSPTLTTTTTTSGSTTTFTSKTGSTLTLR